MVLLLPRDVAPDIRALRRTDGEPTISLLPLECPLADFVMHPARGDAFDFAHHVRETMRGAKTDEEVHMISNAADGLRDSAEGIDGAAEKSVEPSPPFGSDVRCAILGGKDEVVMEGQMRGWHLASIPAPLPGRMIFFVGDPVACATG